MMSALNFFIKNRVCNNLVFKEIEGIPDVVIRVYGQLNVKISTEVSRTGKYILNKIELDNRLMKNGNQYMKIECSK